MATRHSLLGLALIVAAAGCTRGEPPTVVELSTTSGSPTATTAGCPLHVTGARVDAIDTPDGLDLVFTAPPEQRADLRRRVRDAANLYGVGAHKGLGHGGVHLGAQRHGLRLTELPPVRTDVTDTDRGARMHVAAKYGTFVPELRAHLRARVDQVNAAPCD